MIKRLSLRTFRNHASYSVSFAKNHVMIAGENGTGKTSILEAIHLVATTKSHRTTNDADMIMDGAPFAHARLETDLGRYDVVLSKAGKRVSVDNIPKTRLSDYIGHVRVVMFAPEDLGLVKDGPSVRRAFMDLELMQSDRTYLKALQDYRKALRQRNALLKTIGPKDDTTFLDILAEQLALHGDVLMDRRARFLEDLDKTSRQAFGSFSQHSLSLAYKPDVRPGEFRDHLLSRRMTDILQKQTVSGPHRDDFRILHDGLDARTHASQGEQRMTAIALKFGLMALIRNREDIQPVLLLDDVLSELDPVRQDVLLSNLPPGTQVIMSGTTPVGAADIDTIHLTKGD
jgi:DNA replication and repair protein RecF